MNIQQPSNNNQEPISKNDNQNQKPIVKSHVQNIIDKILNDSSLSAQFILASVLYKFACDMTRVYEKLSLVRGELGLAAIDAGFKSADETAKAGLFQLGGGMILAGTGIAQGVAGCKNVTELSEATEIRKSHLEDINNRILKDGDLPLESSDITVKVESIDDTTASTLDEVEEEIFYDAEGTISSKQPKSEEQIEDQMAEKANAQNKITEKKAQQLIEKQNKEYDVKKNLAKARVDRFQGLGGIGQGANLVSQSLGEQEKAKASKETIQKEIAQDNQNQMGNAADDLKRKSDKIAEFDPFQRNSSSLRG